MTDKPFWSKVLNRLNPRPSSPSSQRPHAKSTPDVASPTRLKISKSSAQSDTNLYRPSSPSIPGPKSALKRPSVAVPTSTSTTNLPSTNLATSSSSSLSSQPRYQDPFFPPPTDASSLQSSSSTSLTESSTPAIPVNHLLLKNPHLATSRRVSFSPDPETVHHFNGAEAPAVALAADADVN
ncbi:hypothetical protein HK097_010103, partial [Rhizophlyctis rosea]